MNKRRGLEESYRSLISPISEGLAGYLSVEDWSEGDGYIVINVYGDPRSPAAPDYKISLGNLPMPCPGCGRMRLNFYPDLHRIDCEKCFWVSGQMLTDDEGEFALKLSMLDKEDLKYVVMILRDHVLECDLYNCDEELENTQRIIDRIKGVSDDR